MNIVLLSGGSGQRLWPLSNDIRSKQFIKLFKDKDGNKESMVQRVYNQIKMVDSESSITIATEKKQVDAIKNHLNSSVSICVEPCRKDTFPAILLSALYLKEILQVDENEKIIVCPVDPYVDLSYYENLKKLEHLIDSKTNIALMGIEPTYPSEKYGYIIPDSNSIISDVKEFKEKPLKIDAEKFIEEGALWNAGVFAFNIKYIIDKAHDIIEFSDYNDLLTKYENLEKISFDYAIVEKEENIKALRYSGEWKDVGTWNTMSEVMSEKTIGNVLVDETAKGTTIVNELEIPILCLGTKDLIIAASNDGILVSDKEQSGYMKPLVEKVTGVPKFVENSWGDFSILDISNNSLTAKINIRNGEMIKYHHHNFRNEIWSVVSGHGEIILDGNSRIVREGDCVEIPKSVSHTVKAHTDMTIIEIQMGTKIGEEDINFYELNESIV